MINATKIARPGSVLPLVVILTVFLVGMVALVVDLGYIAVTRSELQNAADAAVLAGGDELRNADAQRRQYNNRDFVLADIKYYEGDNPVRQQAQRVGQSNMAGGAGVVIDKNVGNDPKGDIVIGYTTKAGARGPLQFDTGPYNTVQVTVYRNPTHAGSLSLFFAPVLGIKRADVTATATARVTHAEWSVLPIALDVAVFQNLLNSNNNDPGETDNFAYNPDRAPLSSTDFTNRVTGSSSSPDADGIPEIKLYPEKLGPGNYGTVDLGSLSGSAKDLERQIYHGLNADDRAAMAKQGLLTNGNLVATPTKPLSISGDPGVSWKISKALTDIRGQARTLPLYRAYSGNGTKATFEVVGFANVIVVWVDGGGDKEVIVQPIAPFKILSSPSENQLGSMALVR
jgi:Flp pilus assembly protein TadG